MLNISSSIIALLKDGEIMNKIGRSNPINGRAGRALLSLVRWKALTLFGDPLLKLGNRLKALSPRGDLKGAQICLRYSIVSATGYTGSHDVKVKNNIAYVPGYWDDTLHVVDLSNPKDPSIVAQLTDPKQLHGIHDIVISGDYAYVTCCLNDSIVSINISNPANPFIAGRLEDRTKFNGVHALAKQGNYIFAGSHNKPWLSVIDASDPSNMFIVGSVTDPIFNSGLRGVDVAGDYAYVAGRYSCYLAVIDISVPITPTIVGAIQFTAATTSPNTNINNLRVKDNYVFIPSYIDKSLFIIDVSNPTSPFLTTTLDLKYPLNYIELHGDYAFISYVRGYLLPHGVFIVDISNPAAPRVVASISDYKLDHAAGMDIWGEYLLLATRDTKNLVLTILKIDGTNSESL